MKTNQAIKKGSANLRICKNLQLMAYVLVPARVFTSATQPCSMEVDTRRLVTMPKKKNVCSQHHSLSQERAMIKMLGVMTGNLQQSRVAWDTMWKHARQLTI